MRSLGSSADSWVPCRKRGTEDAPVRAPVSHGRHAARTPQEKASNRCSPSWFPQGPDFMTLPAVFCAVTARSFTQSRTHRLHGV
jgi:hypothetical protein